MVKKIRYFLRYYNILFHLLLGIGFCIISSPLSDLLCYMQKIPDESLFHTIYNIVIPIALFGLWILLLLTNIRDKTYLYKTGRKYGYDSTHYKRSYQELVTFLENLAITIIPDDGSADSKYFTDGARDFFTGICLYLMNQNINISFPEIIQQIVIGNYSKWVLEIMKSSDLSAQAYTNHFYGENEKNVSGTYSKLVSNTRLFGTEIMQTLLRNDNNCISPNDLENCIDIYIQLDPNQMSLYAPVISMIYQDFLSNALYRKIGQTPPIAYIIDEFGQIPAMPVIEQSAALLRAYNCSLLLSCQSLAMIEKHYGTAGRKLLMDCTKAHCFLSIMDPDTRDWASRLIGTKKCLKVSNSEQNQKDGTSGISVTETREKIYEPESFGNLPNEDAVIVYYKGKYIKAEKTYYFK